MNKSILLLMLVLPLLWLQSCKEGENNDKTTLDQTEFLENIGENLIMAGYEDFLAKAEVLAGDAESFQQDPSLSALEDLRESWAEAYISWQKVALYNFGPAEANGILTINFYPTNVSLIESNIAGGSYNLATAANTFAKGFPALDYLLFGYADTDETIVLAFEEDENAATYVVDVANDIHSLARNVHDNWSPTGSNYLATFKGNKGASAGSSLSLLVNAWSQYVELHVRNAKIGTPNGNSVATSQKFGPFPEKMEAYYSETYSKDLLKTAHIALKDFYLGKSASGDGVGLYEMLVDLNAQNGTLADDYLALFTDVEAQLNALNGTWAEAIENDGDAITAIFNNYKAIIALLKVDMVSALSISITYADNDGD